MPPAALAVLYCSQADVEAELSVQGVLGRLDDNFTNTVDGNEQQAMTNALNYATDRVNRYCLPRYNDPNDLVKSWTVNEWATIIASAWLCRRRGNPVPAALAELYKSTMAEMIEIHDGKMEIPSIGLSDSAWPAWSNIRHDPRYRLRQLRVERPISENTPTPYTQNNDWGAEFIFEY